MDTLRCRQGQATLGHLLPPWDISCPAHWLEETIRGVAWYEAVPRAYDTRYEVAHTFILPRQTAPRPHTRCTPPPPPRSSCPPRRAGTA